MRRYQIVEVTESLNHAGSKATADFAKIADQCGYERVNIKMNTTAESKLAKLQRQIGYYFDWNKCYDAIENESVVLLQHPFHHKQLTREKILSKLKCEKRVKFISVVHDVEELRQFMNNQEYYQHEFEFMLEIADVIVVHNSKMLNFFVEKGVHKSPLSRRIFDLRSRVCRIPRNTGMCCLSHFQRGAENAKKNEKNGKKRHHRCGGVCRYDSILCFCR